MEKLSRKIVTYTFEVLFLNDGAHYPSTKRHGYIVLHEDNTTEEIEEICRKHLMENFNEESYGSKKDPSFIGVRITDLHIEEFVDPGTDLLIEGPAKDYVNIDLSQKEAEKVWKEINKKING